MHHLHHPVTRAPVDATRLTGVAVRLVAALFGYVLVRSVEARPAEREALGSPLSHLDGRLLVDAEEGNVGDADEGPFLVGPEHNDGSSLRGLGRNVEVGEANATQVGSQTNEDVPSTVKVGKVDR